MKRFISLITVMAFCLTAIVAFAGSVTNKVPFANMSAGSAAVKTSPVYNVSGAKTKTLHVSGVTLGSSPTSVTYQNMSGTIIAQCAPTSAGPWSGCGRWQDGTGTAVSATANGNQSWQDASPYVRFRWTAGTVATKLKAWFTYLTE